MFKKFLSTNKNSGMTFIELVVVMGIFTAISATVLFNYRDFSDGVQLQNLAQEIALQGKRAQTLASQGRFPRLSQVQQSDIDSGNGDFLPIDWVSSYGLAFDTENLPKSFVFYFNSPQYYTGPSGLNGEYTIEDKNTYFEDFVNSNYGACGSLAGSECAEEIVIADGSYIEFVCLNSEPRTDSDCIAGDLSEKLYISFTRPFLEAYILGEDAFTPVSNAFIKISSQDGTQKRYIEFWSTGQISVS
ncbi:MAG: type II secretion system protein [Candidatus Paceibacterota bacterium]